MKIERKFLYVGTIIGIALLLRFIVYPIVVERAVIDENQSNRTSESSSFVNISTVSISMADGTEVMRHGNRSTGLMKGTPEVERVNFTIRSGDEGLISFSSQSQKNLIGSGEETYIGKHFDLEADASRFFLLKEEVVKLPFLEDEKSYFGYRGYFVSPSGEAELMDESSFVVDYDLSADGSVVGVLQAELIESRVQNRSVCNNCAEISFSISFANYDVKSGVMIDKQHLRDLTMLVNPKLPTKVVDIDKIFVNESNVYTVDFSKPGYAELHGNDLINITLNLSDDGKYFVYKYFDIYSAYGGEEILVADIDALSERYSDGSSYEYSEAWLPGGRFLMSSVASTGDYHINIVNVSDGTGNVVKGPMEILRGWSANDSELLVEAEILGEKELSVLNRYLDFDEREIQLGTQGALPREEPYTLATVDLSNMYVVLKQSRGYTLYDLQKGEYLLDSNEELLN